MVTAVKQRKREGTMSLIDTSLLECSACGQTGLQLMPSGKNFKKHKDGNENCTGGLPKTRDPEPVKVVKRGTPPPVGECVECGETHPPLKAEGKVRKHMNPHTLAVCEQRANVEAKCPLCDRTVNLRKMRFVLHNNLATRGRCVASTKTVSEAQASKTVPVQRKEKPAVEKKVSIYKTLSPLDKSRHKANALGTELTQLPAPFTWRYNLEEDSETATVTLVLLRGKGETEEEMRISWFSGACIGGDGKITHTYRGRTIAVRNANAVRLKAAVDPETVAEEHARVATRKASGPRGPRKVKTTEELQELMPFDPKTADDDTILKAVLGRTIKWENKTAGKTEDDVVKKAPKITRTKTGIRNLSFTGLNTSRTVRIENLVAVS